MFSNEQLSEKVSKTVFLLVLLVILYLDLQK